MGADIPYHHTERGGNVVDINSMSHEQLIDYIHYL